MSLMNDMLRDLDGRGSKQDRALGSFDTPPPKERRRLSGLLWVVMLVGISLVAAWWLLVRQQPEAVVVHMPTKAVPSVTMQSEPAAEEPGEKAPVTEAVTEAAKPSRDIASESVVTDTRPNVPATEVAVSVSDEAMSVSEGVSTAAVEESPAVQTLIDNAEKALAENRLTQPPVNNAFALYSHVLLLEPNNAQALAGIDRVQQRYRELAAAALDRGDTVSAERYIARAKRMGMSETELADLGERLSTATTPDELSARSGAEGSAGASPVQTEQHASASLTRSDSTIAADAVTQAEKWQQQGQVGRAIDLLEPLVLGSGRTEAAARLLFDLYIENGALDKARALAGGSGSAGLDHYMSARLMIEAGDSSQALALLEKAEPTHAIEEPYRALQGALYQRAAKHREAMRVYRFLVSLDRNKPRYWLGLAVAAEGAHENEQALQAFVAAQQLGPISPAVSSYIEQRITALSSQRSQRR